MEKEQILKKFDNKKYLVTEDTFIMGIHWLLANHIAKRFIGFDTILDVCCGAGFMSIPLAKYVNQIIAVDVEPNHVALAKTNTRIAGVRSKIKFMSGDILEKETLNKIPKVDAAFLDPDWARIGNSKKVHVSKFAEMDPPADKLFNKINKLTSNIALRLPKEIDPEELKKLPPHELEPISLNKELKFYCAYFGKLKNNQNLD